MADSRRSGREKGSSAVEMALIMPVLFLFLFGGFEFGRYLWFQHIVSAAAAEAARMGVTPEMTDTEISEWVTDWLTNPTKNGIGVSPTVTITERQPNETFTVTVEAPYQGLVLQHLMGRTVLPERVVSSMTARSEP